MLNESRDSGLPVRRALLLGLMAIPMGIAIAVGAYLFRSLLALVHNIAFQGKFSLAYDATAFVSYNAWGWGILFVPVIGAFIVTFLVKKVAKVPAQGVSDIMDALSYREGKINIRSALASSIAAAFSGGTGASVGREGPVIQIGGVMGYLSSLVMRFNANERCIMIAAGAGAGLAAIFDTPLGAMLFAIELLLPEYTLLSFLPLVMATVSATICGRLFFGFAAEYLVPATLPLEATPERWPEFFLYAALGLLAGGVAWCFIRALNYAEDAFPRWLPNPFLRHMIGMFLVGLILYVMYLNYGHYYVQGAGYASIYFLLQGKWQTLSFLLFMLVTKFCVTILSIGSGAAGGVFSATLYLGAALGSIFACLVLPILSVDQQAAIGIFACAGMAAVLAGTTGAGMTAVVMVFELTQNYSAVLRILIAIAVAMGFRRALTRDTVYTSKLIRRGHLIHEGLVAKEPTVPGTFYR